MLRLTVALTALLTTPALAEETFPATLAGHAVIPADTMIEPPADAPADARVSGKFATGPARVEEPGSVAGDTGELHGNRPTGLSLPFEGQPVQGFSGFAMNRAEDGTIYALTDNGFGTKINSPDALLFFHKIAPDFDEGTVDRRETIFLRDPDKAVPFRIAYEGTDARYLTGADFDPESIQVIGEDVWIGEEFGPYLINASLDGVVKGVYPTVLNGEELRSPDHPSVRVPATAGEDYRVPRSGGYEGMALQPSTGLLWAMLEKPLEGSAERALQVMAFDPEAREWTGQTLKFPLAEGATAIGDFNFIDATRALVIERDNGEGDPSLACEGEPRPDCFPNPARLKRVVLVDTADVSADGVMRRIGHIDLMAIEDPEGKARLETAADRDLTGTFTLPFFTIEDVMRADDTHIVVATDNNLPFSSGRQLDEAMANEFVLLAVPELLSAR
ncbi:esterase-like activity of phytase family protein [Acuticoccus sp.]|uniref:esterase-like activity of phytase family protein n=1 Tax=Acuticoccus sp. TaxID=1904378 RepID=UPI003B52F2B2